MTFHRSEKKWLRRVNSLLIELSLFYFPLHRNDLVLLKLAESVKLDNFINKICLPVQNQFTYLLDEHLLNNVIEDRKFSINR